MPIFYNALLLTGVNLLLRFISTSFQVYLSGRIGAAGIGLLQLVLSVGSLAMTMGMGGIRTATMYLCAEVVGQKRRENMVWVLSACLLYSIVLSSSVGFLLYHFAPKLAAGWLGDAATTPAIRLLAGFLPVNCLCGVMVGYYTGVNRIGTLAAVEVVEQLFSMTVTVLLLTLWAGTSPVKACQGVIMGSGIGACLTLSVLVVLKRREAATGTRIKLGRKLWETAIPLAVADNVKAGISTTENIMVPKRLALYPSTTSPLAAFGMVCGMVFPILMFPAAILYGLAELLIPELARCNAAGSTGRIRHLTQRSILLALVYGCLCGGILFLSAEDLCQRFYQRPEAGKYLRWFAMLAPMLYCDAIVDAMTKGLGQQKICVRYNILTSAMDVALLFVLLPRYGMGGYFFSFLVTHVVNFILSTRLLIKLTGKVISFHRTAFALIAVMGGVFAGRLLPEAWQIASFCTVFGALLILLGVVKKEDFTWFLCIVHPQSKCTD